MTAVDADVDVLEEVPSSSWELHRCYARVAARN
jgi:hypothetical protein